MDGENWYVYANNNPIMFIDPFGLIPTALEAAYMAEHIYKDYDMTSKGLKSRQLEGGWTLIDVIYGGEGLKMGIYSKIQKSGATEYSLVNKGTSVVGDWGNNFQQPLGWSDDMKDSIKYAREFVELNKNNEITMVGHSKGGAEAIANAVATNKNAIVFNPATPNLSAYGLDKTKYTAELTQYIVTDEVLTYYLGIPDIGNVVKLPTQYQILENKKHNGKSHRVINGNRKKNHQMEAVIKSLKKGGY